MNELATLQGTWEKSPVQHFSSASELEAWEDGADIVLAIPPAAEPMMAAFPGLAPNGTMVVLGAPPDNIAVSTMDLIMGRRRLMGSPAGSSKDLRDVLHLAATHGLHPSVTPMPLDDAEQALKKCITEASMGVLSS
jgi:D-arabinose 1-dehydrogenase-like Zn-dependent alcohol dehydrogenase